MTLALTGSLDLSTPGTIKVTASSTKRPVSADVSSAGESVHLTGTWPVTVTDSAGRVYKVVADDGTTAVLTALA